MKSVLYIVATISISLAASTVNGQIANAQAPTPDTGGFNQLDRQPIRQPGVFSNPNSGSRQFFQQGRDNLYFLEESEPILQIDREAEAKEEIEIKEGKVQESNETQQAE